jgi:tRNA (mo5U34)-methyltransferase
VPLLRRKRFRAGRLYVDIGVEERHVQRVRRRLPTSLIRPLSHLRSARATAPHAKGIASSKGSELSLSDEERSRLSAIDWYHTMDLAPGVTTPGYADHRAQVGLYGLPEDMSGLRALDVATFDGFWAFEMERRGANVTAVDLPHWKEMDIPLRWLEAVPDSGSATGDGFRFARDKLQSHVERKELSVYGLTPERLGVFDVVFMSDLLLHLRDPQRALERVYSVTKEGCFAIIAEPYEPNLEGFGEIALTGLRAFVDKTWSVPSTAALRLMIEVAGYSRIEDVSRFGTEFGAAHECPKVVLKAWRD